MRYTQNLFFLQHAGSIFVFFISVNFWLATENEPSQSSLLNRDEILFSWLGYVVLLLLLCLPRRCATSTAI
jgi:hypothetical protein